ncbi:MAG: hypothetical protein SGPRY_007178 [Prymnesium sp.]
MLEDRYHQLDQNCDGYLDEADFIEAETTQPTPTSPPAISSRAKLIAFLGFVMIPVAFIMHGFFYLLSLANWLQSITALFVLSSNHPFTLATALLYLTLTLQCAALGLGIWIAADVRIIMSSTGLHRIGAFGVDDLFKWPHLELATVVYTECLPRFAGSVRACFLVMCFWIAANIALLLDLRRKLSTRKGMEFPLSPKQSFPVHDPN